MNDITTFVGLDVHARSIKACAFVPATGELERRSFGYEPGELASWVASLAQPAKCVYESGVTGFHLCRELRAMDVDCVIGAVSKMHKPAADRGRKTDRRDARFLAVQLALGVIAEVHVPDPGCEGARDLARALADARDDAVRTKQRLSKFLLRHGHVYDERTPSGRPKGRWTRDFWAWVGLVPSEHSSGESQSRGGITKAGNKHLRKLLVEAAWHYKGASRAPKDLAKGQVVAPGVRRHARPKTDEPEGPAVATRCTGASCAMGEY